MNIKRAYKGIPIGFSDGVTRTDNGTIYDLYVVTSDGNFFIGRIGKWDGMFADSFVATPTGHSPFTNRAGSFDTRKDAAIFLFGIYTAGRDWLKEMIANPVPSTTHIPLSAE